MKIIPPENSKIDTSDFINLPQEEGAKAGRIRLSECDGSTCETWMSYSEEDGKKLFIKQLRAELAGREEFRTLFRKEYDVGRQLTSAYFPRFHALEEGPGHGLAIVMDFVDGQSLEQILEEKPSSIKGVNNLLRIAMQLAEALCHLHASNILHLDLKTSNILITRRTGNVVLIDLGFCSAGTWRQSMGRNAQFEAPEQREAQLDQICVSTDIYALGKIIQELAKRTGTELPSWFQSILHYCTEEKPGNRYPSAAKLLEDLRARRAHVKRWRIMRTASICALLIAAVIGIVQIPAVNRQLVGTWYRLTSSNQFKEGRYQYMVTSWKDATVMVFRADSSAYHDIPATVEHDGRQYTITSLADSSFWRHDNMECVVMPHTLKHIGKSAFAKCSILTTIYIPPSITEISDSAFFRCFNLRDIKLPNHLRIINRRLLSECNELVSVQIPDSVKILGYDSFCSCANLKHIDLPEGLRIIERGVFWDCAKLEEIEIPSTVEEFGEFVFWGSGLRTMIMRPHTPPLATNIFGKEESYPHIRIIVPRGTASAYRATSPWNRCTIVEDDN